MDQTSERVSAVDPPGAPEENADTFGVYNAAPDPAEASRAAQSERPEQRRRRSRASGAAVAEPGDDRQGRLARSARRGVGARPRGSSAKLDRSGSRGGEARRRNPAWPLSETMVAWLLDFWGARRWRYLLALLASVYLVQMVSPLRVNTDAITLLSMAASAADGVGFLRDGRPTQFPPGYPALVALLDVAGIAASWSLIALNLVFLAIGIGAAYMILRRSFRLTPPWAVAVCCMSLLSFSLVKYVTLPITDIVFFGLALAALAVLVSVEHNEELMPTEAVPKLVTAGLLILVATSVRTAGIALLAPALWVVFDVARRPMRARKKRDMEERRVVRQGRSGAVVMVRKRRRRQGDLGLLAVELRDAAVLGLGALVIMATTLYVGRTHYFAMITTTYGKNGILTVAGWNLPGKLLDWGELILNVPISQVSGWTGPVRPIWMAVGMLGICALFYGLWLRRRSFGVVEAYLIAYCGIMAFWVSKDVRFWIPVLPLLIGLAIYSVRPVSRYRPVRLVMGVYLTLFVAAGLAALAYSTRISIAGSDFPRLFGGGAYNASYELVIQGYTDRPDQVQEAVVRLLDRYGGFSRPKP